MYVNQAPVPPDSVIDALDKKEAKLPEPESEDEDNVLLTPALTTPEMEVSSLSRPIDMGDHRNQFYPMAASFGSEGHHTTSPGLYNNTPSPATAPNTPVSSAMHSAHTLSTSDYMGHGPFPTSAAEGQIHVAQHSTLPPQQHGNVVSWMPPFRQNIFDPVGYGASQTISQPHIHYQISMPPTSQASELAHSQYSLPFRTGSLGHPNMIAAHPHPAGLTPQGSVYPGTSNNHSG